MRWMYIRTSCSDDTCPAAIAACSWLMLFSATSNDAPPCAAARRGTPAIATKVAADPRRKARLVQSKWR